MIRRLLKRLYFFYRASIWAIIWVQLRVILILPKGIFIVSDIAASMSSRRTLVHHSGIKLIFSTPNWLTKKRAKDFTNDEPETLAWIEEFEEHSVFWDVGANVGSYSMYAAVLKKCEVVAFEPSFLNLVTLQENIRLNNLSDSITIFPIGLSSSTSLKTLFLSKENFMSGGAHNSLGKPVDQYGNTLKDTHRIVVPAETLDDFSKRYDKGVPDYLKIDVDGLELMVLQGATHILRLVSQVSIELLGQNATNRLIHKILRDAGLTRVTPEYANQRNIIYSRPSIK